MQAELGVKQRKSDYEAMRNTRFKQTGKLLRESRIVDHCTPKNCVALQVFGFPHSLIMVTKKSALFYSLRLFPLKQCIFMQTHRHVHT